VIPYNQPMPDKKNMDHTVIPPSGKLELTTNDLGILERKWTPTKRNFVVEEVVGFDWSFKYEKFVKFQRIIDKENDRYFKRIVDPDTGEVIADVDKRLSEHQGHGSAKRPKED